MDSTTCIQLTRDVETHYVAQVDLEVTIVYINQLSSVKTIYYRCPEFWPESGIRK